MADHIHSLGLKAGIYSDAGSNTCGSIWDKDMNGIGSGLYGHEFQDATLYFKEWGFDFIKIDYCGAGQELNLEEEKRYTEIHQAIDNLGCGHVSINICRWAFPGTWARNLARSWRISADIRPEWGSVKYIIDKAELIHSVDSIRLAETIDKEAEKHGVIANILIEVNVAKEESKFGLMPEEVPEFVEKIAGFPHIRVKGLMTIAPFVENPEDNRPVFAHLRKLSVDIAKKNIDNITMSILSMGMTNDYQVAIEEGATMVRVGTGIFGARDYTHQV